MTLFPKLRLFLWRETGGVGMLVAIEASGHVGRLLYLIVAVISEGPAISSFEETKRGELFPGSILKDNL